MSPKRDVCAKCGALLEQPETGRPRVYCGRVCKSAAAYEIKRIQRRLEALEMRLWDERHSPDIGIRDLSGRTQEQVIKAVEAGIGEAEIRLRELLEDSDKAP